MVEIANGEFVPAGTTVYKAQNGTIDEYVADNAWYYISCYKTPQEAFKGACGELHASLVRKYGEVAE